MPVNASNALIVVLVALAAAAAVYTVATFDITGEPPEIDVAPRTDPKLVLYEEMASFHTGFDEVHAIATGPADRAYVAGPKSVRVFSPDGDTLREIELADVRCLAVDDDGTIYAGAGGRVHVVERDGEPAVWKGRASDGRLTSMALSRDGVFVVDYTGRIVRRYSRSGARLNEIAGKDESRGIQGLRAPTPYIDVAVGPDHLVYVANPGYMQIEVYTPDGEPLATWGEGTTEIEDFRPCCNPSHIAILPDGRIVTSEKGEPRVKVYEKEGAFLGVVAGPECFPPPAAVDARTAERPPSDVATDSRGRILVLDPVRRDVRIFVPKTKE